VTQEQYLFESEDQIAFNRRFSYLSENRNLAGRLHSVAGAEDAIKEVGFEIIAAARAGDCDHVAEPRSPQVGRSARARASACRVFAGSGRGGEVKFVAAAVRPV
jgi:hypothetical protein